jgi:hypothetical protein
MINDIIGVGESPILITYISHGTWIKFFYETWICHNPFLTSCFSNMFKKNKKIKKTINKSGSEMTTKKKKRDQNWTLCESKGIQIDRNKKIEDKEKWKDNSSENKL